MPCRSIRERNSHRPPLSRSLCSLAAHKNLGAHSASRSQGWPVHQSTIHSSFNLAGKISLRLSYWELWQAHWRPVAGRNPIQLKSAPTGCANLFAYFPSPFDIPKRASREAANPLATSWHGLGRLGVSHRAFAAQLKTAELRACVCERVKCGCVSAGRPTLRATPPPRR